MVRRCNSISTRININNMAENTPMNQQIMDAIKRQSELAATIKQRYTDQPAFEAGARTSLYGNDKPLADLQSNFSNKVMELYNYDKEKASAMNAPFTTESGMSMPINPMISERANQGQFTQTLKEKEDAWKLYETRKNLLGNALEKAVKAYENQTEMTKAEAAANESVIKSLQALYQEENDMAYKNGLLSLEEKKLKDSLSGAGTDISDMTSEEVKSIDFNKMSDSEVVAAAKGVYGPSVKLGTVTQAPAYARQLLESYKKNGYDVNVLKSTMDAPTRASFTDAITLAADAREALSTLKSKNYYQSLADNTTGPFAGFIGAVTGQSTDNPKVKVRNLIDQMRAGKIKEFYGGAFTTTEEQNASWLPSSSKQESVNIVSLERLVKTAENKVRAALTTSGITGPYQDKIVTELLGSSAGQTDSRPPLTNIFGN